MSVTLNRSDTKLSQINNFCHPVLWDFFTKSALTLKRKQRDDFFAWTLGTRVLSTWLSRFTLANTGFLHLLLWYQSVRCPLYFLVSYFNWRSKPVATRCVFYSVLEYCCHTTSYHHFLDDLFIYIYSLETHVRL